VASLAKYLPPCGFRVHVLTAKNPAAVSQDTRLLEGIPDSVSVERILAPEVPFRLRKVLKRTFGLGGSRSPAEPAKTEAAKVNGGWKHRLKVPIQNLMCPDPQVFWVGRAIRRAAATIEREKIETVLVSAPPFSMFLIGNALKQRYPDLRLVSDFRDEWLDYYLNTLSVNASEYVRRKSAEVERETVRLSDRIVAVTEATRRTMRRRYPQEPAEKFELIPNGYDPQAFVGFHSRPHEGGRTRVTYLGTVYQPTPPESYLEALASLPEAVRARFETLFIGRIENGRHRALLEGAEGVRTIDFLPQQEALRYAEESDYLLLIWNDSLNIPGKLFEYFATGKTVLALTQPGSEVWRIVTATRAGRCVDMADRQAIAALLVEADSRRQAGLENYAPDVEAIRAYERPRLVARYSQMIESLRQARIESVVP
jgi:glycosyltransferase involved in cell wall biosynthesis